jgi:hypothetical protein
VFRRVSPEVRVTPGGLITHGYTAHGIKMILDVQLCARLFNGYGLSPPATFDLHKIAAIEKDLLYDLSDMYCMREVWNPFEGVEQLLTLAMMAGTPTPAQLLTCRIQATFIMCGMDKKREVSVRDEEVTFHWKADGFHCSDSDIVAKVRTMAEGCPTLRLAAVVRRFIIQGRSIHQLVAAGVWTALAGMHVLSIMDVLNWSADAVEMLNSGSIMRSKFDSNMLLKTALTFVEAVVPDAQLSSVSVSLMLRDELRVTSSYGFGRLMMRGACESLDCLVDFFTDPEGFAMALLAKTHSGEKHMLCLYGMFIRGAPVLIQMQSKDAASLSQGFYGKNASEIKDVKFA